MNYCFGVGERGYFNVTGEFLDRGRTDRSAPWTGDIFPGISGQAATDAELQRRALTRADRRRAPDARPMWRRNSRSVHLLRPRHRPSKQCFPPDER